MNFDGIKYIFQIPLAWFKRVNEFVFHTYGGNLVQVRRDRNGAAEIFVDPDELESQVTDLLGSDFVTINTTQTITSAKTITGHDLTMGTGGYGIKFADGAGNVMTLRGYGGTAPGFVMYLGGSTANTIIAAGASSGNMTFAAGATGNIVIGGASAADIQLGKMPTDSTSTTNLRIATLGWVNLYFFRPSANQTGIVYNTNGTITYKAIGTGANDVAAGQHTHTASQITDLPTPPSPYTSTPAALSANGSAGSSANYSRGDHSHPYPDLTELPCTIAGHTGTCLLIVQDDGTVTHSGNEMYTNCKALSDGYQVGLIVVQSHAEGAPANKTQVRNGSVELFHATPYIDFHFANDASDYTSRIIESASGQIQIVSANHAILSVHPADTDLDTTDTTPTSRQIATCGFVNGKLTAASPASATSVAPTSDAADTTTWTAGNSVGLAVKKLYRTKYVTSGTTPILYGYFRTETYDQFGRLYSISGETREVIDQTILITLS